MNGKHQLKSFFTTYIYIHIYALGCPTAQDASHHQEKIIFLAGDPELNFHLPLLLGGGTTQYLLLFSPVFHKSLSCLNLPGNRTCMLLHSYAWHLWWQVSQVTGGHRLGFFLAGITVDWHRCKHFIPNLQLCPKQLWFQHVSTHLKSVFVNNYRRTSYIIQFSEWTLGRKTTNTTTFPRLLCFLLPPWSCPDSWSLYGGAWARPIVLVVLRGANGQSRGSQNINKIEGSNVAGMYTM